MLTTPEEGVLDIISDLKNSSSAEGGAAKSNSKSAHVVGRERDPCVITKKYRDVPQKKNFLSITI